jgi:hypothetical protein
MYQKNDKWKVGIRGIFLSNNEVQKYFPDCPYTTQNKRNSLIDNVIESEK